jgi:hypothetical protein
MEKLKEEIDKKLTDWSLDHNQLLDAILAIVKEHVEGKREEIEESIEFAYTHGKKKAADKIISLLTGGK